MKEILRKYLLFIYAFNSYWSAQYISGLLARLRERRFMKEAVHVDCRHTDG